MSNQGGHATIAALRTPLFLHGLTVDERDAAPLVRGLPAWHVVALALPHSWGAALALWLATLHTERIDALVLLDGGWFDRRDLPARPPPANAHHAAAFQALFASTSSEAWPRLASQRTPTLAVAGTKTDGEAKQRLPEQFVATVPHASVEIFPHLGHDLLRDGPEEVARAAAEWLVQT